MQSYVMSLDRGVDWLSVSESSYLADSTNSADFLPAVEVPWNKDIATTPVVEGSFSGKRIISTL